jgi:alanyl-tRNA synthetase
MLPAYERDPRLREMTVEVLRVEGEGDRAWALLDDTILYPEGGGQPADHGELDGVPVIDVQKVDGELRHYMGEPVSTGAATLRLDWSRRFDHMQQHTAQHLISALAQDRFGWKTTSFHLGAERCDVELDAERLDRRRLDELQEAICEAVRSALPVTTRRVQPEDLEALAVRTRGLPEGHTGSVRLVEIDGIDRNTCGGTHLASTAEIESVLLLDVEPMRGGTRLYWIAGGRVRRRLAERESLLHELRSVVGAGDAELAEIIAGKLDRITTLDRRVRALERQVAESRARDLLASPERVVAGHFADADAAFLQQMARVIAAEGADRVALLTAGSGREGAFVVVSGGADVDLVRAGREVAEVLEGRGGGGGPVFQGKAGDLRRRDPALERLRQLVG